MGKKILTLRDLVGAIKDKASQSKAAFISKPSSSSLHRAVIRATTHAPSSPPEDHISALLTLGDSSRATASSLIVSIMDRLHGTGDSIVAIKCLLVIHQIIKRGPFILQDQLSVFPATGGRNYLKLSAFRDGATASRFTISSCIRFYSRYIESLLYTSRILGYFLSSSSSSSFNTDDKISTFLNSDLLRDVDSLVELIEETVKLPDSVVKLIEETVKLPDSVVELIEETVKLPDSLLLDGNKLLYEVKILLNSDYLSTVNELSIRLSEFKQRISCLSFGDSVELSFTLKRLEGCKERLSVLFPVKKPSTELLWSLVTELSSKIEDLKVDLSSRKLLAFEKSSESTRFNNRSMKFGDSVRFSSGRYEMNKLLVIVDGGGN